MNQNLPLSGDFCNTACTTSLRFWNGSVVLITTWIGAPCAPGSGGSANTKICPPAIELHIPCNTCCNSWAPLLRWSQGLNNMPPKPVPGAMIWNIISYSGSCLPIANICCE